jgi:hypothetical protein
LKLKEKKATTKKKMIPKNNLDQIAMVEATQVTAMAVKTKTKRKKLKN